MTAEEDAAEDEKDLEAEKGLAGAALRAARKQRREAREAERLKRLADKAAARRSGISAEDLRAQRIAEKAAARRAAAAEKIEGSKAQAAKEEVKEEVKEEIKEEVKKEEEQNEVGNTVADVKEEQKTGGDNAEESKSAQEREFHDLLSRRKAMFGEEDEEDEEALEEKKIRDAEKARKGAKDSKDREGKDKREDKTETGEDRRERRDSRRARGSVREGSNEVRKDRTRSQGRRHPRDGSTRRSGRDQDRVRRRSEFRQRSRSRRGGAGRSRSRECQRHGGRSEARAAAREGRHRDRQGNHDRDRSRSDAKRPGARRKVDRAISQSKSPAKGQNGGKGKGEDEAKKEGNEEQGGSSSSSDSSSSDSSDESAPATGKMEEACFSWERAAKPEDIARAAAAAGGTGQSPLAGEVEQFLATAAANIEQEATQRLRMMPPHQQRMVIDRGPINRAANPTSVLICRMRDAELGRAAPGANLALMGAPPVSSNPEIEKLISQYHLDAKASSMLRTLPAEHHDILKKLDMTKARNPSAFVITQLQPVLTSLDLTKNGFNSRDSTTFGMSTMFKQPLYMTSAVTL